MKKILSFLTVFMFFSLTVNAGQWEQDSVGWKYQSDDGSYKTGWYQDVDSKWYYFDDNSGYMLTNTTTPDGHKVSESGVWEKGVEEVAKTDFYDKKIEVEVTAYDSLPVPEELGYVLPVNVYYNEVCDNIYGGKIKISGVEVSKEGLAYLVFDLVDGSGHYGINIRSRYYFPDGTYKEIKENAMSVSSKKTEHISVVLLSRHFSVSRSNPVSVDVFIDSNITE